MNLRRARYLVALAEHQNFTRAATDLHIAQSALSQQIKVLEREIGAALIDRHGPRFALTPAGTVAVREARTLLRVADRAMERIRSAANGSTGRLRLALTRSWAGGVVADLIGEYRARYPGVEVDVRRGPTAQNIRWVRTGAIDTAIVRPPIEQTDVSVIVLDSEPILIAVPAGHHLARNAVIHRPQLIGEPIVFWPRQNAPGMFDRTFEQLWPEAAPAIVRLEADDEEVLHAVARGIGIAPMPSGRARTLRVPGVHLCAVSDPSPTLEVAIAFREDNPNPALGPLLDLVQSTSIPTWTTRGLHPTTRGRRQNR